MIAGIARTRPNLEARIACGKNACTVVVSWTRTGGDLAKTTAVTSMVTAMLVPMESTLATIAASVTMSLALSVDSRPAPTPFTAALPWPGWPVRIWSQSIPNWSRPQSQKTDSWVRARSSAVLVNQCFLKVCKFLFKNISIFYTFFFKNSIVCFVCNNRF